MTHILSGPHDSGDPWRLYDSDGNTVDTFTNEPEMWECVESIGTAMVDLTDETTIYKFAAEVIGKALVRRKPGNEPWNGGPPLS